MSKKRKPYHCKHCKKPGHNRATCPKLVSTRTCPQCKIVGHDEYDCPMRKPCLLCGSRKHSVRKHAGSYQAVLIAGKRAVIQPLAQPGTKLVHVAYEPKTFTLEVAYRGAFRLHRFRFEPVPPLLIDKLRAAKRPEDFLTNEIKPLFRGRYVGRGSK